MTSSAGDISATDLDSSIVSDLAATLPEVPADGRVIVMGGSFNPPHLAHTLLGVAALSSQGVSTLWVLPCADHPFGKALAPFSIRMHLCELAFKNIAGASVLDVEARLPAPNFTVQTLRYLRAARPALRPAFVVGTDILDEIERWREPEALRELCDFIVVPRAGYRRQGRLEIVLPEVSSTEIRKRLKNGDDASGLLARDVLNEISRSGLYSGSLSS